jgi:signal peptidase II
MLKNKQYISIALLILIIDRVFKWFAMHIPSLSDGIFVFKGFFGLKTYINTSFAWGIPIPNYISIILMAIIIVILIYAFISRKLLHSYPSLLLVFSGALSNIYDRVVYKGVIDYLLVPWGGIINVADIAVFFGVALLFFAEKEQHIDY